METLKIMGKEFTKDGKVIIDDKTFKIKSTELMQFSLKELSILDHTDRCKGTKMPPDYVPINKFTDKTSAGLEKAICRFLTLHGHQAERIKNTGVAKDNTKIVTDVLGRTRKIGSIEWRKGTGTNGTHDVHSTIKVNISGHNVGIKVTWEVKIGKDTIKPAQLEYAKKVEDAGGRAYFVRTWLDFYTKYIEFINQYKIL